MEGVFRVSLCFLTEFKDEIMKCNSFESIMEFLRTDLPNLRFESMNRVISNVFGMDLKEKLMMYEIEYHVVQEELASSPVVIEPTREPTRTEPTRTEPTRTESRGSQCDPGPDMNESEAQTITTSSILEMDHEDRLIALQNDVRDQKRENMQLSDQLHVAQSNIHTLESSLDRYKSTMKQLEARLRSVEEERDALMQSNTMIRRRCEKLESELQSCNPSGTASSNEPNITTMTSDDGTFQFHSISGRFV